MNNMKVVGTEVVSLRTACSAMCVTPDTLKKLYAVSGCSLNVGADYSDAPTDCSLVQRLRAHVVDHYRQAGLEEWAGVVQCALEEVGIRLRKREALELTRFYCHDLWEDGHTYWQPSEIVESFLKRNGLARCG